MELEAALELDRDAVLERWFRSIAGTYPKVTATFLVHERDQFRNPVGHAINSAIGPIYDQVLSGMDERVLCDALDEILKVRSVQEFTASAAVGFLFELKAMVRELSSSAPPEALAEIDARVDRVALLAFDRYTGCRERLHDIRANEIRARSIRLLERAGAGPLAVGHEEVDGDEKKRDGR